MADYKKAYLERFNETEILGGRSVEYYAAVEGVDLVILREGDSVGFTIGKDLELTSETKFDVCQPFALYMKLAIMNVTDVYPNLMLTLQRLMATLPSAVEKMVEKGKELEKTPEDFYAYLTELESEDLHEIMNFAMTLHVKINGFENVDKENSLGMKVFSDPGVEKLLAETKAMTEPMFDSWLSVRTSEELNALYSLGELGFMVADELEEREMESALEN